MYNAQSEMVRTTAANSILTQLQKPKDIGPLLNIDMRETSGMAEMKDMLTKLATAQIDAIAAGVSTKAIAAQTIIDVEAK
jgi:ethanolamine utilization protein EutA (predicted chaperonin)